MIRLGTDGGEVDFEEASAAESDDSYVIFKDDGTGEIYMEGSMDAPVSFRWEGNGMFAGQDDEAFMHYELNEADVVTVFIDGDGEATEADFRLS